MGLLQTAGIVSGMGAGLQRGLETMQSGIIQQGLTDADRKFQSEKLQLQMDHAERLQKGTIASHEKEGAATRLQAKDIAEQQITSHESGITQQVMATKENTRAVSETANRHLANEELKIKNDDKFHTAYVAMLKAKPGAGGVAAEKKMNEQDKEAIKAITNAYDGYVKLQQIAGVDPEKFDQYEVLKSHLLDEALSIGGHARRSPAQKGKKVYPPGMDVPASGGDVSASTGIPNTQPGSPQGLINIPDNQYQQPRNNRP